ncbi:type II secretion system secretin GspD [Serratia proteamaculans]|uniref:Type II secretion system secretin GspD n=1 Tax=Serratia proteamaculans TaxID=28151 RepID=A0A7U0RLR6_SERPR|nr:type II secretion system secretin GspD [Serratia proteamaculans]QQX51245.1 type II secretion system secretin GspD [Serratia proteamaculans]
MHAKMTRPLITKALIFIAMLAIVLCMITPVQAEEFSANFKGTDIHEFISTASKALGKTIIIDDGVKGKVTVRSYEPLDAGQYYQFFLNVLDVYGYAVISMPNNVLKVIPAKDGKRAALSSLKTPAEGDELIMRIVPLNNIAAKEVAPLMRQFNDSIGIGNVVFLESGNALLITGRADVVNSLVELAHEMDRTDQASVASVALQHASAADVVSIVTTLFRDESRTKRGVQPGMKVVADERTNTVLIAGEPTIQARVKSIIRQLDQEKASQGNTKVIRLKYAKAQSLLEVLSGVSANLQDDKKSAGANVSVMKNMVIKADELTNALIINATPDVMSNLEKVIEQLDIRRAQVLVEAVIVEMQNADGLNLGIQWANRYGGGTQFGNAQAQIAPGFKGGMEEVFKNANGLVTGFYSGNWAGLLTAISNQSQNNILATPSIMTLDNEDAEFSVGQDVPILTGSQTTNSDNVFNTVSRKTVGIKLKVKPQINKGQSVLLQIEQEVSSVAENSSVDKDNLGATFNIRTVNNTVLVESGETVVVGGLLDKSQSDSKSAVPFLERIPLLGALFRSTSHKESKRNLILFIRPTVIRSTEEYAQESLRKVARFRSLNAQSLPLKAHADAQLDMVGAAENGAFKQARQQIDGFYRQGRQ